MFTKYAAFPHAATSRILLRSHRHLARHAAPSDGSDRAVVCALTRALTPTGDHRITIAPLEQRRPRMRLPSVVGPNEGTQDSFGFNDFYGDNTVRTFATGQLFLDTSAAPSYNVTYTFLFAESDFKNVFENFAAPGRTLVDDNTGNNYGQSLTSNISSSGKLDFAFTGDLGTVATTVSTNRTSEYR